MFVGKVCSYSASQYGDIITINFTMLGREFRDQAPRYESFTVKNFTNLTLETLESLDNEKYCYVYNRCGDGDLEKYEWSDIKREWREFGYFASLKDGKARVAFPL